jgi:hypothetical protein
MMFFLRGEVGVAPDERDAARELADKLERSLLLRSPRRVRDAPLGRVVVDQPPGDSTVLAPGEAPELPRSDAPPEPASPRGFDCSGLVQYAYAQLGMSVPHSTYALWPMGVAVARSALQPGDLVFFNGLGHMGIYIGNNQMIHAPHTGDVVKISSLTGWYASSYMGARRIG